MLAWQGLSGIHIATKLSSCRLSLFRKLLQISELVVADVCLMVFVSVCMMRRITTLGPNLQTLKY